MTETLLQTRPTTSTTMSAVLASDFSQSTADRNRARWDGGKFRALIAALGEGNRVIITIDRQTGHTLADAEIVGVRGPGYGQVGDRVIVRHFWIDASGVQGHQDTAYSCFDIGAAVIVPDRVKWDALTAHREMTGEAIAMVREIHGESAGRSWGHWRARLTVSGAHVTYEPLTGNAHFREQWGDHLSADVFGGDVHNVRTHEVTRPLCDQVPTRR
jgi:hypothetical protein